MLQYTQNLFEHDRIRKQAKLILIRLLWIIIDLGDDHLTWRGGGGHGFFLNKYSDSQCCWKKYSDFGGGKKNNMIHQSFCHIT